MKNETPSDVLRAMIGYLDDHADADHNGDSYVPNDAMRMQVAFLDRAESALLREEKRNAAAPDMLAALELVEQWGKDCGAFDDNPYDDAVLKAVRAAIAKARGKA